jgi:hypothetical protein
VPLVRAANLGLFTSRSARAASTIPTEAKWRDLRSLSLAPTTNLGAPSWPSFGQGGINNRTADHSNPVILSEAKDLRLLCANLLTRCL